MLHSNTTSEVESTLYKTYNVEPTEVLQVTDNTTEGDENEKLWDYNTKEAQK